MKSPSHTLRIALPLAVLAAVLWSLPFMIQRLPALGRLLQNVTQSPTQMSPSGSTLLLNEVTTCRAKPDDSAAAIAMVPAGMQLPIVAQYQWWYLVQVQLSGSQYNRCWVNPTASTVQGPVAAIPVVTDPEEVALLPAADTPGIPITGQETPKAPKVGQPQPGAPNATSALVGAPAGATTVIVPSSVIVMPTLIIVPPMITATSTPIVPILVYPTHIFVIKPSDTPEPPFIRVFPTHIIKPSDTPEPPPILVYPTHIFVIKPTPTP